MRYANTFVLVSEDCPVAAGMAPPPVPGRRIRAEIELKPLRSAPYRLDHDELNFEVHRQQKQQAGEPALSRTEFLARGHPCMRASALVKRYGWGAHYDAEGRIAVHGAESREYAALSRPAEGHRIIRGMRARKA